MGRLVAPVATMRGRRPVLSARSGKVRARWTGRVHVRGPDRARGGWARPRRAGVADGPAPGGTVVGPEGGAAPAAPARRRRAGTPTTRLGDRARGAAPVRRARHAWPAVPVRRRRPGVPGRRALRRHRRGDDGVLAGGR